MGCTQAHVKLNEFEGIVTINEPVLRYPGNPILTCHEVNKAWGDDNRLYAYTVHNAGIATVTDANGNTVIYKDDSTTAAFTVSSMLTDDSTTTTRLRAA